MNRIERVRCPNCGSFGERHHILDSRIVRTQCPECDYLMVTCTDTGKVLEAYAPGLSLDHIPCRSRSLDRLIDNPAITQS